MIYQIQIIQEIVAVLLNNDFFRICRFEDDTESGIAEFQFSFDPGLAPADGCFQLPGIGFRDKYGIRLTRDGIEFQAAGKGGKLYIHALQLQFLQDSCQQGVGVSQFEMDQAAGMTAFETAHTQCICRFRIRFEMNRTMTQSGRTAG